jgi:hypothetical protein
LQTNTPNTQKKNGDTNNDPNLEETTLCSVCENEMSTPKPGIYTCNKCQQWIKECLEIIAIKDEDKQEKGNLTRTQRDDETEFERIPIAGENESDCEDSDEYEEEEDSSLPYLDGEDLEDTNSTNTEDSHFESVPIVIALSGPAPESANEQEMKRHIQIMTMTLSAQQ